MLKIGYKASAEQFGTSDLLRFALLAEESGFDSVGVSDHFQPWRHTGGHAPTAFVWLGALAPRRKRVQIGTRVATPTCRYHAALGALLAPTIEGLAPARACLGLGEDDSRNG